MATSFKIRGEFIELTKLLKAIGAVENGGAAQAMVDAGEVKLNGEVESRRRAKIRPGDKIEFGSETIVAE